MAVVSIKDTLDDREMAMINHAIIYDKYHQAAGIPGHGQLILIAKLIRMIQDRDDAIVSRPEKIIKQQLVYDKTNSVWRDILTGVITDIEDRYAGPRDE